MSFYKVKESEIKYSEIPEDGNLYTSAMDKKYSQFSRYYDLFNNSLSTMENMAKKDASIHRGAKCLGSFFWNRLLDDKLRGKLSRKWDRLQ